MYDKITQKDVKRMEEEIEHRKLVVRKDAIRDVQEARAHGDLSENFEYKAAKQFKNQNESRIRYLERMIKTARIISEDSEADEVGVNNIVTIYLPEDDEEEIYKIVTTVRSDSMKGKISIDSPLGKALLRHKVNDRVSIKVNDTYSFDAIIRKIDKVDDDGTDELRKY
ncbi:MAG: transcription elongation factor GreA [Herbinix sp.]|nr:transcription elongation factor GreA [Herbinix sp.]